MEKHIAKKTGATVHIDLLGTFITIGIGMGALLGLVSSNIASGTLFGIIFGAGLGLLLNKRRK